MVAAIGGVGQALSVGVTPIGRGGAPGELTDAEQAEVRRLRQVDAEVRAHERAHQTAGGSVTGAATFQTVRGPDGKLYAIGGEVSIDVSPANDPRETIRKMEIVIRAALAPAVPSAQDRAVAAQAKRILIEAQQQLNAERAEENQDGNALQPGNAIQQNAAQAYSQADNLINAVNVAERPLFALSI